MQATEETTKFTTIRPVLAALSRQLPRRERVDAFRQVGNAALIQAARVASAPDLHFSRDEDGAPTPEGDWSWSLTNAEGLVAAVVSDCAVGIDVEPFDRPRRETLLAYLQERDPAGLKRMGGDGTAALILWTAFEAALKLLGLGVSGLPDTKLDSTSVLLPAPWHVVRVGLQTIPVWSSPCGDHVLSLAVAAPLDQLPEITPLNLIGEHSQADLDPHRGASA
ncbi:MAG: phosphopantetheinyl transferase [Planctomycetota bacterium]|jgi:phosphopantetheinyl transferase